MLPLPAPANQSNPDASLLRLCAEHAANVEALRLKGCWEDDCPLWDAYVRTFDAISAAEPQTVQGLLAKARAAVTEATAQDGSVHPEGTPAMDWAWDVTLDLLRLHGRA
ncbi:MAG: hypothetical protein DI601_08095 [Azospirillum brasilense]|nr:MAG: hypothetical protein DI601_08095 [Azospirillum brasilense]